jgi:hypothetical protein
LLPIRDKIYAEAFTIFHFPFRRNWKLFERILREIRFRSSHFSVEREDMLLAGSGKPIWISGFPASHPNTKAESYFFVYWSANNPK